MTRRDVGLTALAAAWTAWATGAEIVSIRAGVVENHLLDLAVGAAYLIAGVVALRRNPASRLAYLMIIVAFLWFVWNYGNADKSLAVSIGAAFGGLSLPLVIWLFFAYPNGRLQTGAERLYVAAFVAWQFVFGIVTALTLDPRAACASCSSSGIAVFADAATVTQMENIDQAFGYVLPLVGGLLFFLKHRRASAVERRALTPLWVGGALLVRVLRDRRVRRRRPDPRRRFLHARPA